MRSHGSRQHKCCPRMRTACTHPGEARIAHRFGFDARRSKRARKHRWQSARRGGSRAYDARAAGGPNLPVGESVRLAGGRWTGEAAVGSTPRGARATVTPPLQRSFRAPPPSIACLRPPSRLLLICDLRLMLRLLLSPMPKRPPPDLRRRKHNTSKSARQQPCTVVFGRW